MSSTRLGTEYSRVHEYHLSITPGTHLGTKYSANSRIILRLYRHVFHISSQYAVKKGNFTINAITINLNTAQIKIYWVLWQTSKLSLEGVWNVGTIQIIGVLDLNWGIYTYICVHLCVIFMCWCKPIIDWFFTVLKTIDLKWWMIMKQTPPRKPKCLFLINYLDAIHSSIY